VTGTVAFIDTETTGLDPRLHWAWEIAVILPDGDHEGEHVWRVLMYPDQMADADPAALDNGGFHTRYDEADAETPLRSAEMLRDLIDGRHLIGANPGFDVSMLGRLFNGPDDVPWHYHYLDVSALAIGYLYGLADEFLPHEAEAELRAMPPYSSSRLGEQLGVEPATEAERHTALGDARWARRMYERITHA